ncbi:PREDICTED: uncharacterized protein LOC107171280 [Diuraphis noxia]|uniref:uncharacterized protein LOC107171280 n=1 Tax=Diuraphis noxia TaxID=143948 RepID=UPI000763693C|nr:PREDICTED: uncharacterized protein LOC107171280 [Diuraphis noxia]
MASVQYVEKWSLVVSLASSKVVKSVRNSQTNSSKLYIFFFSFYVQTFWWSLSTTVSCVLVEQASERRITVDSVTLPEIPMASEESVHMLTAVRFPPPALFFANPDKKWSLDDFDKPDSVATYSVTDDVTDIQDEQDAYQQQDPATTTESETEAEAVATTISIAVDDLVNGLQQTASDGHVESLQPTDNGHAENLQPADDGHVESLQPTNDAVAESLQPTSDALTESLQPTHDRLVDSQLTTAGRLVVTPKQQPTPVRVVNQLPTDSWSEKRWTALRNRPRRPVASEHDRLQIRKIVLTSRPLPVPDANVRFPDVEYAVAQLGERKNLHDFRRQ